MSHLFLLLFIFVLLCGNDNVLARDITVLGLFKNQAIVSIDGTRYRLTVDQSPVPNIILIAANSETAVIEIDGTRRTFRLGQPTHLTIKPPTQVQSKIAANAMGMYVSSGYINNKRVKFLVDTGATLVALNRNEAKRLNIDLTAARSIIVATAAGQVPAYVVTLSKVKLGAIELTNVDAMVLTGNDPQIVLLGMSFLNRLHIENRDSLFILTQKY